LTTADRGAELRETVRQPGLVWCYRRTDDGETKVEAVVPPADCTFRWIHLNLSDVRSLRWLEEEAALPPSIHTLMIKRDSHQRFVFEGDTLGLVLHDFERGFDSEAIGRIGGLHVALKPGLIITGRYRPLHSADIFRARLESGQAPEDATGALHLLLDVLVDNLGMAYGITGDLDKAKETFEYGISKDPDYPLFYYNLACTYGEKKDMDKAIEYLKLAFDRRENMIPGERMPNPATDSSFKQFMQNEKFRAALKELKAK